MNRKQLLLDSVKKLLALNVSDDEIILNLKDVGINEAQARQLLDEARGKQAMEPQEDLPAEALEEEVPGLQEQDLEAEPIPAKKQKKEETVFSPRSEEEAAETVTEALDEISEKEEKKEHEKIRERAAERAVEKHALKETHDDLSKLWEKGILLTVNEALQEMKKIRLDLNKVLDEKIRIETEKELKKVKALQESQQVLIMHKMDAALQKKSDEVNELIDEKIKFLAKSSKDIQAQTEKLEAKRQVEKSLFEQLSAQLADLKKNKDYVVSEFNSELIKARSAVQEMLDDAEKKIEEIDARANKTLELESTIAEGLVKDARLKIETISVEKSGELERTLKKEIAEIEKIKSVVKMDELQPKLNELKKSIADLDLFKQQFARVIETNVEKFNKQAKIINDTLVKFEEQQNSRIKAIDAKIKELDEFEKKFSQEMAGILDKN